MDVNIDSSSRVFFFIKNIEDSFGEVLVPDMAGISIDKNNRPVVLRSKSSFFRTYKGKGRNLSIKKRLRGSLKKKTEPSNNAQGRIYILICRYAKNFKNNRQRIKKYCEGWD